MEGRSEDSSERVHAPLLILRLESYVQGPAESLGTKGSPQLTASKETGTLVLQVRGTEFCQPLNDQGNRISHQASREEYIPANILILARWVLDQTSGFQDYEMVSLIVLSYEVCGDLWQHRKLIQLAF